MIPVVALIGRTNVGKSSLFNAIVGHRVAIVEDTPGVTRDRHMAIVNRYETPFWIIDTGGILGDEDDNYQDMVREQALLAVDEADIVLCVFDGIHGPHKDDEEVVRILRKSGKPIIWVINKTEKKDAELQATEFYAYGIEDPILVSAAHRLRIGEVTARIKSLSETLKNLSGPVPEDDQGLKIALVGKPNVGKSTLINRFIGKPRLLVADQAHTTRDAIDITFKFNGQPVTVVDTAGLRKKAKVEDGSIERFSTLRTTQAIAGSDVVIVVLDATEGIPSDQDKRIALVAHERGKGLIFVLNKWDAVEKDYKSVKEFEGALREAFKFAPYAPILFASGLTGKRCPNIIEKAFEVQKNRTTRIPTNKLNTLLQIAFKRSTPPTYRTEPIRLYFTTQIGETPPTILVFVNHPRALGDVYERYLRKAIREEYPLEGTDIRILFKKKTEKAARKDFIENEDGTFTAKFPDEQMVIEEDIDDDENDEVASSEQILNLDSERE